MSEMCSGMEGVGYITNRYYEWYCVLCGANNTNSAGILRQHERKIGLVTSLKVEVKMSEMDALKARAIRTVYQMIELTKGQMDGNDILDLGMFFGSLDPTQEALGILREAYDAHHKAEKDRGLLADRVSEACTALLRLGDGRAVSNEASVAWNVIHELRNVVDQYEDAVQFALKERQ